VPTSLLVGGDRLPGRGDLEVLDPATGHVLARVADAGPEDGLAAVAAAHEAFEGWSQTAPRVRAELLRRAFDIMTAELEDCAALITAENGKAWRDAMAEASYAAEFFRWFSERACAVSGDFRTAPGGDKTIVVDHRPMGVAYLITPWNFPAAMATRKLAPALAAGCTTILKPAAETPLTALWVVDVLRRAGAPDGVVNVLTTSASGEVSSAVLADRRTATLSFTGSTYVGKLLLAQTAQRVMPASMELGGNAPFLVLEGASVDTAVSAAMVAKMRNGGSACTAANRFYVHASLEEEFSRQFADALAAMRIGPGADRTNDLGAMVSLKERDKVQALLDQGAAEGGRVRTVSTAPEQGAFIAPSIVRGVSHGSTLTRNEIFGPVAPVVTFEDEDEGIRMANDSEYGLISYVVARDAGEGLRVGRRMTSGMVAVNRGVASDPAAPFGGTNESGIGREGGFAGIHEFLHSQYLAVDL
jgi:succinate-semialdehyde dehydrogenase/glutarate-semialdehyde dehydrogenase